MRSLDRLGRSSEAKDRKKPKKVKYDGRTDQRTDGPTKRVVASCSTRLKSYGHSKIGKGSIAYCTKSLERYHATKLPEAL